MKEFMTFDSEKPLARNVLHHLRAFLYLLSGHSRRHHPADALPRRLLLAVVRSQISSPPTADSAAAAFNISKDLISAEATNWQRALMMTGPIAFAFAEAIDKQLAHAVGAN
jgi:hypothetical protein